MNRKVPRRLAATVRQLSGHVDLNSGDRTRAALIDRLRQTIQDENVVGFGIAEKQSDGQWTGTLGITFYVREKRDRARMAAAVAIPELVADAQGRAIYTDIVEVGVVEAHAQAQSTPIQSGFSVCNEHGPPGTVGAIVAKGGRLHILSAQHVLADYDRASEGDTVLYPASADGGTIANAVGTLLAYRPLDRSQGYANRVDAALCLVNPAAIPSVDRSIPGASEPLRVGDAETGMRVVLSGRTSGESHSVVRGLMVQADIWHAPIGLVGFREQIACDPFSQGGDSGAAVVDAGSGRVIGLVIGGSGRISFVTPIRAVLNSLGARLA